MLHMISRLFVALLLIGTLPLVPLISAQQIISVDPGNAWLDATDGYSDTVTWRVASRGGSSSPKGIFVDLASNRVLDTVNAPLRISGDEGEVREKITIPAAKARQWYREGVRHLGYRRTFSGAAGSLSNRVEFDLQASGRLAQVIAVPEQQTLTGNSRRMMLAWNLSNDIGEVNAVSESGQFLLGDRVIYEVHRPLYSEDSVDSSLSEVVDLPEGLVRDLMDSGIYQLRYSRTFVDDKGTRRSASVALNLTP